MFHTRFNNKLNHMDYIFFLHEFGYNTVYKKTAILFSYGFIWSNIFTL